MANLNACTIEFTSKSQLHIGKEICEGRFGAICDALIINTFDPVAVKIVEKKKLISEKLIRNEIEILKEITSHPNIVQYIGAFQDDHCHYIVTELCDIDLDRKLKFYPRFFTLARVKLLMKQIASGLCHLKDIHGIIHRDIKLSHLLLDITDTVKITDFGTAVRNDPGRLNETICGDPYYMCREKVLHKAHGYETDMWSLGCVLYMMLVGKSAFGDESVEETFDNIFYYNFVIPGSKVTYEASDLIKRLLEPIKEIRIQCHEVLKHMFLVDVEVKQESQDVLMHKFMTDVEVKQENKLTSKNQLQILNEVYTSFGTICDAYIRETLRPVAVKMVKDKYIDQSELIRNEIEILQEIISHPNIVQYIGAFQDDHCHYIVTELCDIDLDRKLKLDPRFFTLARVKLLMKQIVSGLYHIKEIHGIIHGDIKLSHLLLDKNNTVKITGFGSAVHNTPGRLSETFCGDPSYMSRERVLHQAHGYEADMWSLGCVLYMMLVGKSAFGDERVEETFDNIIHNNFDILDSKVTYEASDLIKRLLEPIKEKRFHCHDVLRHRFLTDVEVKQDNKLTSKHQLKIVKEIHKSYGTICDAFVRETFDPVALKIVEKKHPIAEKLIRNEIEILQEINSHPNIVQYIGAFQDDRCHYIVTELCEIDLDRKLKLDPRFFTLARVKLLMKQIVSGLYHLKEIHGIIHGDIKLSHLLLDKNNTVKITGFGTAVRNTPGRLNETFCGDPSYMSQERVLHQSYGYEADMWSLGCVLYMMLVGKSAFGDESVEEIFDNIVLNNFDFPGSKVTYPSSDLIKRLLEPIKERRIQCHEVLEHGFFADVVEVKQESQDVLRHRFLANVEVKQDNKAKDSRNLKTKGISRFSCPRIEISRTRLKHGTVTIRKVPGNERQANEVYLEILNKDSRVSEVMKISEDGTEVTLYKLKSSYLLENKPVVNQLLSTISQHHYRFDNLPKYLNKYYKYISNVVEFYDGTVVEIDSTNTKLIYAGGKLENVESLTHTLPKEMLKKWYSAKEMQSLLFNEEKHLNKIEPYFNNSLFPVTYGINLNKSIAKF